MAGSTEHRIFDVPELLEAVLVMLPTRDLLLSKSVCKTWKKCINSSAKIQKALFLKPDGEVWSNLKAIEATESGKARLRFNPLLKKHLFRLHEGHYTRDSRRKVIIYDLLLGCDKVWKKMLITQPPIAEFSTSFYWDDHEDADEDYAYVTVKNSKGLTMRDLTRALEKELRRCADLPDSYRLSTFDVEGLAGGNSDYGEEDDEEHDGPG